MDSFCFMQHILAMDKYYSKNNKIHSYWIHEIHFSRLKTKAKLKKNPRELSNIKDNNT